jgi:hypothetical protein
LWQTVSSRPEATLTQIQILLALYNGAAYLPEQLASIAGQTHGDWCLLVSDDGSRDDGPRMIEDFAAQQGRDRVRMIEGPCRGAAANFMHLLRQSDPQVPYLACCDQDDVWLPHKLERAIAALAELPEDQPALYCSRTLVCDATLGDRTLSPGPRRALSFRNALVQNVVAGNTVVLNRAAAELARTGAERIVAVAVHDWWLYQIVTGVGGRVVHDDMPGLLYRQHGSNEIGAHHGLQAGLSRITQVLRGRFRQWNEMNAAALSALAAEFTPENRAVFDDFTRNRAGPLPHRLRALYRSRVYRQSGLGNAALWLSALLGRI